MAEYTISSQDYKILLQFAELFTERGSENISFETSIYELKINPLSLPQHWNSNQKILIEIFRFVWSKVVYRSNHIIKDGGDSRDVLSEVFSNIFNLFLIDEKILGKCIILESHRYNKEKIKHCFSIPEVTEFLDLIRKYIKTQTHGGHFLSINPDSLLELFLSIQDGMMFAWIIGDDIGYPSKFTISDFDSISKCLISSILIHPLEQSKTYYDSFASVYDRLYTDGISLAENFIVGHELTRYTKRGDVILDLGCGSGLGYQLVSKKLGGNLVFTGIDISSEMINIARKKWPDSNAKFYVMDMSDLSFFKKNKFDMVISLFGSFSHVLDPIRAIAEIERVLRPGGTLFLMVYSKYSIKNIFDCVKKFSVKYINEVHPYEIRRTYAPLYVDARFYTTASINNYLKNFSDLRISGLNALLEIPFFRKRFLSYEKFNKSKHLLLKERFILKNPNLFHSLIIRGKK